jgi:hypothetical protein
MGDVWATVTVEVWDEVGTRHCSVTNTAIAFVAGDGTYIAGAADTAVEKARQMTTGMLTDRYGDRRFD